jgi:hypothetical protein
VEPLVVRISSSTEWLGKRNERSRETLSFETRAERDLMLVLHRPIEPTAQSGHPSTARECPLLGGICCKTRAIVAAGLVLSFCHSPSFREAKQNHLHPS